MSMRPESDDDLVEELLREIGRMYPAKGDRRQGQRRRPGQRRRAADADARTNARASIYATNTAAAAADDE